MKRISRLPMLAVVAVVALVLGSFGTAVAGPAITKGKVKAIAAKVVKKQAPSLSVASAATAGNASLLNGQAASSYQTPTYRFRLPTGGGATFEKTYTLNGVPAGNYLASYTAFGMTTATGQVACYVQTGGAASTAEAYNAGSKSSFSTPSGSGLITVAAGTPAVLHCYEATAGTFTLYNSTQYVSTIALTRVDAITAGSVTAARSDDQGGRPSQ